MNDREFPYAALRAHLGGDSRISMVLRPDAEREYQRTWDCGCMAVYRDTPNHTARWRPCPIHRAIPATPPAPDTADDAVPKILSTVGRRQTPQFFLVDDKLNVLAMSGFEDIREVIQSAIKALLPLNEDTPTIVGLTDHVFLRVIPLRGSGTIAKIVFIENVKGRRGVPTAAQRFDLTKREIEVLELLIASKSNPEIARALWIAESTAQEHVKNIFRKMKTNRRTEVITKLFEPPE